MTPLASALFAAMLLSLTPAWYPPDKRPETDADLRERYAVIAKAVATEAPRVDSSWPTHALAFAAIVTFHGESRFALDVHSGERLGDRGRAACLGQLHRYGMTHEQWERLTGTSLDATRRCARATMEAIARSDRYCQHRHRAARPMRERVARALSLYGSGRTCGPLTSSKKRARTWSRLVAAFWGNP